MAGTNTNDAVRLVLVLGVGSPVERFRLGIGRVSWPQWKTRCQRIGLGEQRAVRPLLVVDLLAQLVCRRDAVCLVDKDRGALPLFLT